MRGSISVRQLSASIGGDDPSAVHWLTASSVFTSRHGCWSRPCQQRGSILWIRCPCSDLEQRQHDVREARWRASTAIQFTPCAIMERMLKSVQHQDV